MKEVQNTEEVRRLLQSSKPVAIFFYLEGCGHCEAMKQPWKELESEKKDVDFAKVESEYVPSELGITGFPHFVLIQDGKQQKEVGGEMEKQDLKAKLFGGGRRRRSTKRRRTRRSTRRVRKSTH